MNSHIDELKSFICDIACKTLRYNNVTLQKKYYVL